MKRLLACLLLFVGATLAFAQGKITFGNDTAHLVVMTTDTTRLLPPDVVDAGLPVPPFGQLPGGHTLWVDLWAGTSSSQLALLTTTTFSSTAGIFGPANVTLPGMPGGIADYFQVQIHDSLAAGFAAAAAGTELYYGESPVFTCVPGGVNPAPIDQNSAPADSTWLGNIAVQMNPVPEPTALALALLGAAFLARASFIGKPAAHWWRSRA